MYKHERILEGARNARDLGGIETADGKVFKYGRVIRSNMLMKLTDKDVEYLKSIGLNKVVDFRTTQERMEKPDRVIEGVDYIVCALLDRKTEGITREKPMDDDEEALRSIDMARRLMQLNPDGREQMKSLYPILVSSDTSLQGYKRFFDILLHHEEGALLYHCTMGKDRVGTGTALLLSMLGVPTETIVADYLITAERCAKDTERLINNCRRFTDDEEILQFIYYLDTVEPDFILAVFETIDRLHGGMESFRRNILGIGDAELIRLRELYLE